MHIVDKELDVSGTSCPLPLIRVRQAVRALQTGSILRVTGDDPIFEESIVDLCNESEFTVLEIIKLGRKVTILIQM